MDQTPPSSDTQPLAPSPLPVEAVKVSPSSTGVSWIALVVACVLTASASVVANQYLMRNSGEPQFVFLDAQKLIQAKGLELADKIVKMGGDSRKARIAEESQAFSEGIRQYISELGQHGYVVINGAAVLSENSDRDMTQVAADKLGVQLSYLDRVDEGAPQGKESTSATPAPKPSHTKEATEAAVPVAPSVSE